MPVSPLWLLSLWFWLASLSSGALWSYGSAFVVLVGVVGETITELTEWIKPESARKRVAKISAIVLIFGLTGDLLGIRETQLEVAFLTKEAGDAKTSAEGAASSASRAKTSADEANKAAGAALGKSKTAKDASEHALALARTTEKYAAWRTISDKQADVIVKHLGPLKGHSLEMFDFTTDPETSGYAQRLGTVLGKVMHTRLSEYPGKFIPPPGLSFTVGKDREKDFALIVEALDMAGVEKASALRKTAEHRAPDDGIEINVGGKH